MWRFEARPQERLKLIAGQGDEAEGARAAQGQRWGHNVALIGLKPADGLPCWRIKRARDCATVVTTRAQCTLDGGHEFGRLHAVTRGLEFNLAPFLQDMLARDRAKGRGGLHRAIAAHEGRLHHDLLGQRFNHRRCRCPCKTGADTGIHDRRMFQRPDARVARGRPIRAADQPIRAGAKHKGQPEDCAIVTV